MNDDTNQSAFCEITTSDGHTVIIDSDNLEYFKSLKWFVGNGYAMTKLDGRLQYMHHIVLPDIPQGMVRDHINRNKLDNRRENLRIVSPGRNALNHDRQSYGKVEYLGVIIDRRNGFYLARLGGVSLGLYRDAKDAALAYDCGRRLAVGDDGGYNFPDEPTPPDVQRRVEKRLRGLAEGVMGKTYRGTTRNLNVTFDSYIAQCGGERIGIYYSEKDAAHARDRYIINQGWLNKNRYYVLNFPLKMYQDDPELGYRGAVPKVKGQSQYIGVAPKRNRWRGYIYYDGKQRSTGVYATEYEAANAREEYIIRNGLQSKCPMNFADDSDQKAA